MWCPFELSDRERDIIQAHLDREIDHIKAREGNYLGNLSKCG